MQALLTRSPTLASKAIRTRLRERHSHAMGLVAPGLVLDSTFTHGGVRERDLHQALAGVDAVRELWVPLPDEASGLACARDLIGAGYDWPAIWSFGIGSRDWQDPARWWCFELIAAWWRAGGLDDFDGLPFVTGAHLEAVARRLGRVRERRLDLAPARPFGAPSNPTDS